MANDTNGVIYLEVDEDITSAIDKLTKAESNTVQIVSAKRSTLFQSVINVKLLQKAAKDAKKELILVTADHVVMNLAGRIGVPVASQVGEEPKIPSADNPVEAASDDEIDGGSVGEQPEAAKPVAVATSPLETPPAAQPDAPKPEAKPQPQKAKGQRVPNIGTMQKRILWGAAGVLLIALLLGLNYYLTTAKVSLFAKSTQGNATLQFTADPGAKSSSSDTGVLSAQQLTLNKSLTASVQGTGTKDKGTKASGTMTVSNCFDSSPHTLVAGTRFKSSSGLIFLSTQDVTVPGGTGSFFGCSTPGTATVPVQAEANGDQYNLGGGTKYTIPGLSSSQQAGITGTGGQMSGGTTKTATVITQADVDKAQKSALDGDKGTATKDLANKAGSQQVVLDASLQQKVTSADSNPDVGAEAQNATLTIQVTYTQLAVQKSALSDLAKAQETKQFGSQNQIYDDGTGSMQLTAGDKSDSGAQSFKADVTAYYGSKIDTVALAKDLKGKKYGEAVDTASRVPGVDKVELTLSPSWATSVPGITSHIHIEIKASNTSGQ